MASLQASCTLLFSKSRSHSSSQPLISKRPSHLLTKPRSSSHFRVSCNQKGGETSQGKVDRRNMLLGLGGLYGAANLVGNQSAYADPVQAPDVTKCNDPTDVISGKAIDAKCCPPPPQNNIIDYKLPPVHGPLRIRKPAHLLNKDETAKYEAAIRAMRELDKTDPQDPRGFMQQANVHCAYCNGVYDQVGQGTLDLQVHNSWLFFPFHRWYLYFYERILGKLIGDPNFALPYWNWDYTKGMPMPPIFDNPNSPLYDAVRDPKNRGSALIDLARSGSEDVEQLKSNNLAQMYSEMVRTVNTAIDFMGKPYCSGTDPSPGPGSSENGSHTSAHIWVGTKDTSGPNKFNEDMGNFYSAGRDPLFYCHHSNVDRMWKIWREDLKNASKDITSPNFLNAEFLFYDENKQLVRVKVADTIDHRRMGFDYFPMPLQWLGSKPPKKTAKAKVQNLTDAKSVATLLPINLKRIVRVIVPKSAKGNVPEQLVLEDIVTDSTKLIKFDIFINDEDDKYDQIDRAEYVGTFQQLPHKTKKKDAKRTLTFSLKEIYEDIDIADDDTIVLTIVPKDNGDTVTIGGIKIVPLPSA